MDCIYTHRLTFLKYHHAITRRRLEWRRTGGGVGILAAVASSDIGLISSFEKSLHVVLRIGLGKFQ